MLPYSGLINLQKLFAVFLCAVCFIFEGCVGIGAKVLPSDRSRYNIAIQESNEEQLLLNLVRLKYRDAPFFLEVGAVAAQFSYGVNAFAKATLPDTGINIFGLGGGGDVRETPTVTYSPLQGESFIQRLLSKIPIKTIFLLHHSGWSIERILRMCLEQFGNVKNAPSASGPTPDYVPEFASFQDVIKHLRSLQKAGGINIFLEKDGKSLLIKINPNSAKREDSKALKKILGLDENTNFFHLTASPSEKGELKIETRSLLGILYYLSHSLEVPQNDVKAGKVTISLDSKGQPFDWSEVTGDILSIKSSANLPEETAVKVYYRENWFYVEDNDLNSKSTLSLLAQIFALQAGGIDVQEPILTLPVGN